MGLINKISNRILGNEKNAKADKIIKQATLRRCSFETMEERKVLSADPVVAGITYLEGDEGGDSLPDHFEVTFEGGSETTELSQFVVNGDQDLSGTLTSGDIFFDATDAEPGTAESHGFIFDAENSSGLTASDVQSVTVSEDGLSLTVEVDNFEAGDVLAFTIDVDEVEGRRADRIASGVEVEGTIFSASFEDEHFTFEGITIDAQTTLIDGFVQDQGEGIFFDEFDDLLTVGENLSGGELDLPRDNELGLEDRTAGAVDAFNLVERPIAISGTVFHDENIDCIHDENDEGIAGVNIDLQLLNEETGVYETVASTVTDENGDYEFGLDLGLPPGTYQLVQTQPDGFLDTGALAGSEGGSVLDDANGNQNIITGIEIPLGNTISTDNDFKEVRPASVSGFVSIGTPGETKLSPDDPNFRGIEGVTIQLFDVEGNLVEETQTDASGRYEFDNLAPGTYSIAQIQPDGFLDGSDVLGNIDGETTGVLGNDRFDSIELGSGDDAVRFDFCEHEPASIKGTVYHDRNNDGIQNEGEEGIAGVVIQLFDADGNVVQETTTDENGEYCFEDLLAGEYKIRELQPENFDDGIDTVGTVDGETNGEHANDQFCVINLEGGDQGVEYNFGELRLAEISGNVHVDNNGDKVFDPGIEPTDRPIEGVTLELLDESGNVLATTETAADGSYSFNQLLPGTYSIRQIQPDEFFSGGEIAGTGGGDISENLIENIVIESGQQLTQYDFCEHDDAEIHGRVFEDGPAFETEDGTLPTNFRNQRDSVFQEGVDTPIEGVRLELFFFIDPTAGPEGEISPRPVTISEVQAEFYPNIDASDPNAAVFVETDADGNYWFQGLRAGNYVVLEVQPDNFFDANDVPGTTTGSTFNSDNDVQTAFAPLTRTFSNVQLQDVVAGIQVENGGISQQNNFTEVSVVIAPPAPEPPETITPQTPPDPNPLGNPITPRPGITGLPGLFGSEASAFTQFVGTSRGASFQTQQTAVSDPYTWHLSVINGGQPRAFGGDGEVDSIWHQAGHIDSTDWNRYDMNEAVWTFTTMNEDHDITVNSEKSTFGMIGGTPLAGDFDGDGIDDMAVFKDGYWLIDINHNGRWDQEDLFAKLGGEEDRPVVGDWDGDGKDDIGIFGPMWERDEEAIDLDPGLPNPDNELATRPKNVPPADADATNGARIMKLTSYGNKRADVVDHVFGTEEGSVMPVTGDWNGNGIRSIGKFVDGHWEVDVNGDGRFNFEDSTFDFGRAGDIPLTGDFNGDGVEEIAVYRSGQWLIDTDGNRELDATDKSFQLGGAADKPVVGDFNGDGIDEPAIYSERSSNAIEL